ncbi:MAG TPA: hypothetical protein VGC32_21645 [Solirubrobacterales bacterium]
MEEVHEFISYGFGADIESDAQFATMAELEPPMLAQERLRLRLVWADEAALDAAEPRVEADPRAMALFSRFDLDSMRYARFKSVARAEGIA